MRSGIWIRLFPVFFVISFIAVNTAQAAKASVASRIDLNDGTVYEDVEFTVNKSYKVITIKTEAGEKNISFTNISRILDKDGEDITAKYLGKYKKPAQSVQEESGEPVQKTEDWLEETDPVREKYNKPLWSVAFPVCVGFSIPVGDYYEGTSPGVGFSGEVLIALNRNLSLRGTVAKSGMKDDPEKIVPGFRILEDNLNFDVWRYFLSLQYSKGPNWSANKKTGLFVYGGLGAVSHKISGDMLIQDPATDSVFMIVDLGTGESKFAATSGFGFVGLLSPSFGIEFGSSLDVVIIGTQESNYQYSPYGNVQTALVIDFKVGIITFL